MPIIYIYIHRAVYFHLVYKKDTAGMHNLPRYPHYHLEMIIVIITMSGRSSLHAELRKTGSIHHLKIYVRFSSSFFKLL